MPEINLIMANYTPFKLLGPGHFLLEEIESRGWNLEGFKRRMGLVDESIHRLMNSELEINKEIADKLSSLFGQSSQFWMNLDSNYRNRKEKTD